MDPTGNMSWSQVGDLKDGFISSFGDTWNSVKSLFTWDTAQGIWDLGKALCNGKVSIWDLGKAALTSAIQPFDYVGINTYYIFAKNPTDSEVYRYGKELGNVLQAVAGSSGAYKILSKVSSKLVEFLKKLPNRFSKGTGKAVNLTVRPVASNSKLQNIIKDLYKGQNGPNRLGNGTTMDAIRHELKTGNPVNGKFHSQKGKEYINALNKVLRSNISSNDKAIAEALLKDLQKALAGK